MAVSADDELDATTESQPVDWLYLPLPVTRALREAGIETVGDLTLTAIRQLRRCQALARLSEHDWVVLVRMLRRSLPYSPPPHRRSAAAAGGAVTALDLPGSAARALERWGITHLGELTNWTLADFLGLKSLGASGVAAILCRLVANLPPPSRSEPVGLEATAADAAGTAESEAVRRHWRRAGPRIGGSGGGET